MMTAGSNTASLEGQLNCTHKVEQEMEPATLSGDCTERIPESGHLGLWARAMGEESEHSVAFGPFRLCPKQRLLLEKDKHLRLGSRALDILITLVERSGELVSKQELNARVWPGMIVEDSNLKVHVAALRRTLRDGKDGNRYICTVPGRGYCFVAPVARSSLLTPNEARQAWDVSPVTMKAVSNRDLIRKLAAQLPPQHFIAVIGVVTQLDHDRRR